MRIVRLAVTIALLSLALCASAQDATGGRLCTDLSGRFHLPCPGEKQSDPLPEITATPSPETRPQSRVVPASVATETSVQPASPLGGPFPSPVIVPASQPAPSVRSLEGALARNFVRDEVDIWTSPRRLRAEDARWLLPLSGAVTAVVLSDGSIERQLPTNPNLIRQAKSFSDYGAVAYGGMVGAAYLWSRATNNDHMREAAVLSGEAALHSLLITEGIKYIAGRERPLEGDGTGSFRRGGGSFPSLHSAGAWAIASVLAREYPGPLTQVLAYGGAAAISAARVTGRQHFGSDVLVGSAIGWFAGRQVYNAHRERDDPAAAYGTFVRDRGDRGPRDPEYMGSSYVPLDSWVYPAIDRLAALGYAPTAFAGLRPWTRLECARIVEEAGSFLTNGSETESTEARSLFEALQGEFAVEARRRQGAGNVSFEIESLYGRVTGISGRPLQDSYHFGQTIINDYGRPYGEGANLVGGFAARGEVGPLSVYVRAEYQHAPDFPGVSLPVQQAIANIDGTPLPGSFARPVVDRVRLVEGYVALNVSGTEISFGKQSLWWGPSRSGPFLASTNAEPIPMLRIDRVHPVKLPSFLGLLGPVRTEFFIGQLDGQAFVRLPNSNSTVAISPSSTQPFLHGQKLSFKPTPNLEFSVSRTVIFGGYSRPLNLRAFYDSVFSFSNKLRYDPGDRRSAVDFTYRIPGLRNWLVLYDDSFTEDEYSPIGYPRRSSHQIGLYMPRFPGLPKLQLRGEGMFTDMPGEVAAYTDAYWNSQYRSGYTNEGQIIGNWVGREGRGMQFWGTYSFSPRNMIEVSYRKQAVNPEYLKGGLLHDVAANATWLIRNDLGIKTSIAYDRWNFPLLSSQKKSNIVTTFQLTYWPKWSMSKRD